MKKIFLIALILTLPVLSGLFAQQVDSVKVRTNYYSLNVGIGWSHYINDLEIGADNAKINSPGVTLRFFWEPEHRLSLGLESGFYRLYKVTGGPESKGEGKVTMSALPLLLLVRMRVIDHFHLSAGAGLAMMFNKISGIDSQISSNILSVSNYQFSASYNYPISKRWVGGAEFKVQNFGKTADWMYGVQLFCAVRL